MPAATVNNNVALDGSVVAVKDMHFARAASEAIEGIVGDVALCIGRRERRFDAWSLKRDPCVLEPFRWLDQD